MANGVLRGDGTIMQQPPGIGEYTFGIDIAFSWQV
jgi:replicative DNA helicase